MEQERERNIVLLPPREKQASQRIAAQITFVSMCMYNNAGTDRRTDGPRGDGHGRTDTRTDGHLGVVGKRIKTFLLP